MGLESEEGLEQVGMEMVGGLCLEGLTAQLSQLSVVAVISDISVTETMDVRRHPEAWFHNLLKHWAAFHLFNIYLLHVHLVSGTMLDVREITLNKAVVPAQGACCSYRKL